MTQEEKELLLVDLCARLTYGVVVEYTAGDGSATIDCHIDCISIRSQCVGIIDNPDKPFVWRDIISIKPYLRPLSSMTEGEKMELYTRAYAPDEMKTLDKKLYVIQTNAKNAADFYNEHHFDYRGLIEKGLALEAPAGMYDGNKEEDKPEQIPDTIEAAVAMLDTIISDEDKEYILKNGSISVHHSLGRWIRNNWGLWEEGELKECLRAKGIEHPDDMSDYIIQRFIDHIKK